MRWGAAIPKFFCLFFGRSVLDLEGIVAQQWAYPPHNFWVSVIAVENRPGDWHKKTDRSAMVKMWRIYGTSTKTWCLRPPQNQISNLFCNRPCFRKHLRNNRSQRFLMPKPIFHDELAGHGFWFGHDLHRLCGSHGTRDEIRNPILGDGWFRQWVGWVTGWKNWGSKLPFPGVLLHIITYYHVSLLLLLLLQVTPRTPHVASRMFVSRKSQWVMFASIQTLKHTRPNMLICCNVISKAASGGVVCQCCCFQNQLSSKDW